MALQEKFYKHVKDLMDAIEDSLLKGRILPCLTLLYAGIDVMASLERKRNETVRASFERWVNAYILDKGNFQCNSLDLYAARCGIVHTFSAHSDLISKGARHVAYAWGNQPLEVLEEVRVTLGMTQDVCVHVNDLVIAFGVGLANFMQDLSSDSERGKQATSRVAGLWLVDISRQY